MIGSFTDFHRTASGLRRLFPHFGISRKVVVAVVVISTLAAVLEGLGIGLLLPMLELLRPNAPAEPMRAIRLLQSWLPGRASGFYTIVLCFLVAGSIILKNILIYVCNRITAYMRAAALVNLRVAIFDRLQKASLDLFENTPAGNMANVLLLDTGRTAYSLEFLIFFAQRSLIALGYVAALLFISWQLSILAGLLALLCGLALSYAYRALARSGRDITGLAERVNSHLMEVLGGIRVIRHTNSQAKESEKFRALNSEYGRIQQESMEAAAALNPLTESVGIVGGMLIVGLAAVYLVQPGHMKAEMLLGFAFVLLRLLPAVNMVYGLYGQLINLAGGVEQSEKWMKTPQYPKRPFGKLPFQGIERSIQVRDLSFHYPSGTTALDGVSFEMEAGKITALVGGSGSGKSTLAAVLLRLREASSGCILVDGMDHRDFSPETWHRYVSIVEQEAFLFRDSLAANVRYGFEEARPEQVRESLRRAHLDHVLAELPEGENTIVGERGATLSGGQRQRMSIARAIVRDPKLLVLDEATSALDSVSEAQVQAAIEEAQQGRTVLIIAHRFSTIRRAHKIVVLDKGRVVEQGTWEELQSRRGEFSRLLSASQRALV
jgi:ABC-type multidrug transport system fused ATPase/permease subunit